MAWRKDKKGPLMRSKVAMTHKDCHEIGWGRLHGVEADAEKMDSDTDTRTYLFSSVHYSFALNHFQVQPKPFYSFLTLEKVQLAIRANRNSNEMGNYLCPFPTYESTHVVQYPK